MRVLPRHWFLVCIYVLMTFSLYAPFWVMRTWGEMRRVGAVAGSDTGLREGIRICLPIISSFQVAAHARGVNQVLVRGQERLRINVAVVVVLSVVAWLLVSPFSVPAAIELYEAGMSVGRAGLLIYYSAVVAVAASAAYMEFALNRGWTAIGNSEALVFGRIESALLVVGVLFWLWRISTFVS